MSSLRLISASLFAFFLFSFTDSVKNCDKVPALNVEIVKFVKSKVNKKVGRGECWDLAAEALDASGANWDHDYKFGDIVDLKKKDCVYPGDIIQFENVDIKYRKGNTFYHEVLAHHTAIIYEVKQDETFVIAQQNTSEHGRKVSLDPFDFQTVTKGKFTVYRPKKN